MEIVNCFSVNTPTAERFSFLNEKKTASLGPNFHSALIMSWFRWRIKALFKLSVPGKKMGRVMARCTDQLAVGSSGWCLAVQRRKIHSTYSHGGKGVHSALSASSLRLSPPHLVSLVSPMHWNVILLHCRLLPMLLSLYICCLNRAWLNLLPGTFPNCRWKMPFLCTECHNHLLPCGRSLTTYAVQSFWVGDAI